MARGRARRAAGLTCSSGTYVRALVAELGDAYCLQLRRTAIGPFVADGAWPTQGPAALTELAPAWRAIGGATPQLSAEQVRLVVSGRPLEGVAAPAAGPLPLLLLDAAGAPVALAEPRADGRLAPIVGLRGDGPSRAERDSLSACGSSTSRLRSPARAALRSAPSTACTPGHRRVIGDADTVLTFDPHPVAVVAPSHTPRLLTRLAVKADIIAGLGVQELIVIRFDAAFAALERIAVHRPRDRRAARCRSRARRGELPLRPRRAGPRRRCSQPTRALRPRVVPAARGRRRGRLLEPDPLPRRRRRGGARPRGCSTAPFELRGHRRQRRSPAGASSASRRRT